MRVEYKKGGKRRELRSLCGVYTQMNEGGMPCFNLGVGGPYSNGHKQDENASIDEIVDCAKIAALLYLRKLG